MADDLTQELQSADTSKRRKRRSGRPRVHIDLVELEKLAGLQCTDDELAAWFDVSRKAIARKKRTDPAFREALERGRARGRVSVRRVLFATAQAGKQGSVAAAIFLAKNLLGYKDAGVGDEGARPTNVQEAMNELRSLYGLPPQELNVPAKTQDTDTQSESPLAEAKPAKTAFESFKETNPKGYVQ